MNTDRRGRRHNGGMAQLSKERRAEVMIEMHERQRAIEKGWPEAAADPERVWRERLFGRVFESLKMKRST